MKMHKVTQANKETEQEMETGKLDEAFDGEEEPATEHVDTIDVDALDGEDATLDIEKEKQDKEEAEKQKLDKEKVQCLEEVAEANTKKKQEKALNTALANKLNELRIASHDAGGRKGEKQTVVESKEDTKEGDGGNLNKNDEDELVTREVGVGEEVDIDPPLNYQDVMGENVDPTEELYKVAPIEILQKMEPVNVFGQSIGDEVDEEKEGDGLGSDVEKNDKGRKGSNKKKGVRKEEKRSC
ncbi:uncharacterized protein LOC131876050 [Cryptomeria japonica]|uniref:uncharacterized protein LOC131876050 n=1 Tax=Cryptomeria japonica TaxID=3369 RepID=UPI0027D9D071|nr:uncharacterized protein LOC131876050 [Cryptomeria japonica]